jgi:Rps23 Pro-64 3,4-dihydroxylase Tpa1-like proline 4-hydroxylase
MLTYPDAPPVIVPPAWNSLNIFTVPHDHLVSAVSPAATAKRYSLTGWLRR